MKKLAAGLLAFALMVMLLPAGVVVSFAASGKLSFSDPTVSVGYQISVTIVCCCVSRITVLITLFDSTSAA